MKRTLLASLALLATIVPGAAADPAADTVSIYIGSYAKDSEPGIHHFKLDMSSGALTPAGGTSGVANPSFVAISPDKKYLYAIGEAAIPGKKGGAVASFSIDEKSGALTQLSLQSSVGAGPCYVTADKTGKVVLVANYGGGSIASLPVSADGKLSEAATFVQHEGSSINKGNQAGPHAHSINVSPDNKFALAADLGIDKIMVYKLDPDKGTMTANDPPSVSLPPGSGPRHFAFHPSAKYVYACGEINSTVNVFTYDADKGALKHIQALSTLPEAVKGNSTAECQVHPSGKFVYVSNRGHDSVAVFHVDEATGKLTAAGHCPTGGKTPRNFGVDPTGKILIACNQSSNNVVVFKIDEKTGMPKPAGHEVQVPKPVCVKYLAR